MIERFYLKDFLSFNEAELNLESGLVVFTGPSGSGKSILMDAILSSVGFSSCEAKVCESNTTWSINEDEHGIENEDVNIFKHTKKEKARYFINAQSVSKKTISTISSEHIKHLSLKDYSDFENNNLLGILDLQIKAKHAKFEKLLESHKEHFKRYKSVATKLETLLEEERKVHELKEFARFEVSKIEEIAPKSGEDEELLAIKKQLSQKEKAQEQIEAANQIFEFEAQVNSALNTLDIDSSFFDDTMNELRATLDSAEERFDALNEVDIEEVLNRIEQLSELKRRYGSIEDALEYKEQKLKELERYENIEITKGDLENEHAKLQKEVQTSAKELSNYRHKALKGFEDGLNTYLSQLYLRNAEVNLHAKTLDFDGEDELEIILNATSLQKLSTGEFNRLRLAVLALKSEQMKGQGGVLLLDEIDANLSGEESMSVAKVLKQLSKHFQIFVISHQPQLTSMGDQHFLIYKDADTSHAKKLSSDERINEIARIISGENISNEARTFAKELLEAAHSCA